MKNSKEKKALFLDRDGVINEDFGYVGKIENFKFLPGVFEAIKGFIKLKFEIFIVTNQSGIARGYYSLEDFYSVNDFMLKEFQKEKIEIKKVYFCPHSPEQNCKCRKPNPGMILKAKDEFGINLQNSILVGDKISDIKAGQNAGLKECYLIGKDCKSLKDLYDKIIKSKG